MKILIFGAYGLLGGYLTKYLSKKHNIVKIGRNYKSQVMLNKFNNKNILKIFRNYSPDCVINLIALTDVDKCEKNKRLCFKTNSEITKEIVNAIDKFKSEKKIFFILISSDQVYSGKGPHLEKKTRPILSISAKSINEFARFRSSLDNFRSVASSR